MYKMYAKPRFLPAGDSALIVELGDEISERCSEKVVALAKELKSVEGILEIVPIYRSLLVYYDPSIIKSDNLKNKSVERAKASIAKGKTF